MKKTGLVLFLLLGAMTMQAGELISYTNISIWNQGSRNTSRQGSALATSSGRVFSLLNVINRTDPYDIDFMAAFAKTDRRRGQESQLLFAPGNPEVRNIDWNRQRGTLPFCLMEATASGEVDEEASLRGWDVRNETRMQRVTGIDFENATYEMIAALNPAGFWVTNIQPGDIIAFETASTSKNPNKKGLIQVLSINDNPDRPERIGQGGFQGMTLNITMQK